MIYIPVAAIAGVIVLYLLLRLGLSYLSASRHSLGEELTYIGITLVSVALAVVGARLISRVLVDAAYERLLLPQLDQDARLLLSFAPTGAAGLKEMVRLLLVPVLFLLIFVFHHTIAAIIARIPWHFVRKHREERDDFIPVRRWGFACTGLANGLLVALAVLVPLCGMIAMFSGAAVDFIDTGAYETKTVRRAVSDTLDTDPDQLADYVTQLDDDLVIRMFGRGPGGALCRLMTTGTVRTETGSFKISLSEELHAIAKGGGLGVRAAILASSKPNTLSEEDKALILDLEASLLSSEWLTQTGAEAVAGIADLWASGDTLGKIAPPKINDILAPVFDLAVDLFRAETADILRDDVETVTDILLDLADSRLFVKKISYSKVMERLGKDGLMFDILARLRANPHLAPLADELQALSIRVISSVLNVDKLREGTYDELLGEVALRLNDVLNLSREEREAEVRRGVQEAFDRYGYQVSDDIAVELAEQVIGELGADGSVTIEEIKQFLIDHDAKIIGLD